MTFTFSGVLIGVAIVALVLTLCLKFTTDRAKNFFISLLQNFCGILFLFSGWVKAVDPMGTAFKMEQYFAEFQATFEGTAFDFLSGLFPIMSTYSIAFSVVMIVLEIVIGLMLVIGARPKLASWIFLFLIVFFTILTGFTYLTGYVPTTSNFFSFSEWTSYTESNMRVTDCGCFGDFLKIKPKVSFMKDVFLLLPALILIFKTKDMHQLFTRKARNIIVLTSTVGLIWYCLSNFSWDLPHMDFRPFREGVSIRDKRQLEIDAVENLPIIAMLVEHNETKEQTEVPFDVYMKNFASTYKGAYSVLEQITPEPTVKPTKLSEFVVTDSDGYDVADDILNNPDYELLVISYQVPYNVRYETLTAQDTVYAMDTIMVQGDDKPTVVKSISEIKDREVRRPIYTFDAGYLKDYAKKMAGLINDSKIPTRAILGGLDPLGTKALRNELGINMSYYEADDLLLKTMIRSNPGLILMKDGMLIRKWHKEKLPSLDELNKMTK